MLNYLSIAELQWYDIVLIVLGGVVFIASVAFITIFFTYKYALIDKQKTSAAVKELYKEFVEAVGGKDNIEQCTSIGSRLNIVVKDIDLVDQKQIQDIQSKKIGIVRTSKKITFVVGDFADRYRLEINKILNGEK